ncbi:hypothetical protein [Robinsoniella peoriensis]|uniref:hypothetical protein n=1 Tax=Robinsoniella peoriensis TaxID=180332 RepID=UPI001364CAD8|nr:hypothetical protein [Robinsoniella peoriensis]
MKKKTRCRYLIKLICEEQMRLAKRGLYETKEYIDLEKIKVTINKLMDDKGK